VLNSARRETPPVCQEQLSRVCAGLRAPRALDVCAPKSLALSPGCATCSCRSATPAGVGCAASVAAQMRAQKLSPQLPHGRLHIDDPHARRTAQEAPLRLLCVLPALCRFLCTESADGFRKSPTTPHNRQRARRTPFCDRQRTSTCLRVPAQAQLLKFPTLAAIQWTSCLRFHSSTPAALGEATGNH